MWQKFAQKIQVQWDLTYLRATRKKCEEHGVLKKLENFKQRGLSEIIIDCNEISNANLNPKSSQHVHLQPCSSENSVIHSIIIILSIAKGHLINMITSRYFMMQFF